VPVQPAARAWSWGLRPHAVRRHRVHHPNLTASGLDGRPVIPATAHIRLASSEYNDGTRILRRGYSFTDGIDPQEGTPPSSGCRSRWPTTHSTSTSSMSPAPCSPSASSTGARPELCPW